MALQGAELRMLLSQCCVCFGAGMLVTLQVLLQGAGRVLSEWVVRFGASMLVTLQGDRGTCPPKSLHHSDSSDSSTLQRHPSAALCSGTSMPPPKRAHHFGTSNLEQDVAAATAAPKRARADSSAHAAPSNRPCSGTKLAGRL